jgi:cytochrome oxidase assembly protein ShyY1
MSRYLTRKMIGIHFLGFLALASCLALAAWQWDRAHMAQSPTSSQESVPFEKLSPLRDFLPLSSVGAKTKVSGIWQPGERILLPERIPNGPSLVNPNPDKIVFKEFVAPIGFWVVDILELADGSSVGVVRGFTTDPKSTPAAVGRAEVSGVLQPSEDAPDVHLVNKLQLLTTNMITAKAKTIAHDGYLVANAGDGDLTPVVPIVAPSHKSKLHVRNVIYTFNWLIFGLIVLAMWRQIVRDELESTTLLENRRN